MRYRKILLVAVLGFICCGALEVGRAQNNQQGAKGSKFVEVEVLFLDGSRVRMTLAQEHIEVITRYGKLEVPVGEIRSIEFGVRIPDDSRKQIEAAIKDLSASEYKKRDNAQRTLTALGVYSYILLAKNPRANDLEVSTRIEAILNEIREKAPKNITQLREEDIVIAAEFKIIGRISSTNLKTSSKYFGDVSLKVAELQSLRSRGSGSVDVNIDAAKFGSPPAQWMDTGSFVNVGAKLNITASGTIDLWPQGPGQYLSSPKGYSTTANKDGHIPGQLLGRLGENGPVFVIGERLEITTDKEGKLFLQVAPSSWNNASMGQYQVKVRSD